MSFPVLIFVDYYSPGYKAGGPIQTIENMVDRLGDDINFFIYTRNVDLGETTPYRGMLSDAWTDVGKAKVFYASESQHTFWRMRRVINATPHRVLYLNSVFSVDFSIKPLILRLLNLTPPTSVVLAPRGEFGRGAISIKSVRKKLFLSIAKAVGLYRKVCWHASTRLEAEEIYDAIGQSADVAIALDLPKKSYGVELMKRISAKELGKLKILWLSRISPKKNLDGALRALSRVKSNVEFNIYGPVDDKHYWAKCEGLLKKLPSNVSAQYCGPVRHEDVCSIMSMHDLFYFPTKSENFGHVILEALVSGCPVLISDQTPWRNLADVGVGWDITLANTDTHVQIIEMCAAMDDEQQQAFAERARQYGLSWIQSDEEVKRYRQLFFRGESRGADGGTV